MKEYIERSEMESILHNRYDKLAGLRPDFYAGYMMAFHTIEDDVPTAADVVGVVRCRECIAYTPVDDNTGKCVFLIGEHQYVVPDGYCYLGERKEGADNG